jgi:hypothetical protein
MIFGSLEPVELRNEFRPMPFTPGVLVRKVSTRCGTGSAKDPSEPLACKRSPPVRI